MAAREQQAGTNRTTSSRGTRRVTAGGRVDQAQMRRANMALILRHLRDAGGRSRARLATETGLSKATMSSLISDLVDRGLVREGDLDRAGSVGRPGLTVALDGRTVSGVGVEINVDYVALTAVDLTGAVVRETVTPIDIPHLDVAVAVERIAGLIGRMVDSLEQSGSTVISVTVAPPGVIDYDTGSVRFAPNLGWRAVPLVAELATRLGPGGPEIHLENDAKLAAVAEFSTYAHEGVNDLLFLTGDVGVGAGIISEGRLVRGWSGFAGEVGHLPLDPDGHECKCGRSGCWELIVGLTAFLDLAAGADDPVHSPARSIEDRLMTLRSRADAGDERVLTALRTISERLTPGLSLLIDVLNPRLIVLGGYFASFGDYLLEPLARSLEQRRMDSGSIADLAVSRLGLTSASRGGALVALEDVFNDPTIVELRAAKGARTTTA